MTRQGPGRQKLLPAPAISDVGWGRPPIVPEISFAFFESEKFTFGDVFYGNEL